MCSILQGHCHKSYPLKLALQLYPAWWCSFVYVHVSSMHANVGIWCLVNTSSQLLYDHLGCHDHHNLILVSIVLHWQRPTYETYLPILVSPTQVVWMVTYISWVLILMNMTALGATVEWSATQWLQIIHTHEHSQHGHTTFMYCMIPESETKYLWTKLRPVRIPLSLIGHRHFNYTVF